MMMTTIVKNENCNNDKIIFKRKADERIREAIFVKYPFNLLALLLSFFSFCTAKLKAHIVALFFLSIDLIQKIVQTSLLSHLIFSKYPYC